MKKNSIKILLLILFLLFLLTYLYYFVFKSNNIDNEIGNSIYNNIDYNKYEKSNIDFHIISEKINEEGKQVNTDDNFIDINLNDINIEFKSNISREK